MWAVLALGLHGLSVWAERAGSSYPWRSEDYLRYLIPTLIGRGEGTILLAGPSEAREDLIYERFEKAFPRSRAVQGGLSLGTFDDFLVALEYWRAMFGDDAVPRTIVLGITPRFVANLPAGTSPLAQTITRYSPRFAVRTTPHGSELIEKRLDQKLRARGRFLLKQPERYRAALCTFVLRNGARFRPGTVPTAASRQGVPVGGNLVETFWLWLDLCRSPYKYRALEPMEPEIIEEWIAEPTSIWTAAHEWDPEANAPRVREQFARLQSFVAQLEIELFIVNLPEHPLNRARYRPGRYERYLELVRESVGETPFLELRDLLSADLFYDAGHATSEGAVMVTDATIRMIRLARREVVH